MFQEFVRRLLPEFKNQASLFPIDEATNDEELSPFVDSSRLGRYAEFMVCAELTKLGYHTIHVDAPGFDIIASVYGASARVQVKSTSTVRRSSQARKAGHEFCVWVCRQHAESSNHGTNKVRGKRTLDHRDADIVALFHHKFNTITFLPISAINGSGSVVLPLSQVKQNFAKQSLDIALKKMGYLDAEGG